MENEWILTKDAWPEEGRVIDFELNGYVLDGVREGEDVDFYFYNPKYEKGFSLRAKMNQIIKWKYHES
jgi:hypothetical protein